MPYVSLSWLRDHVAVPEGTSLEEVAEALVSVGFEEEEIHPPAVTGPLVVGRVLTLVKEEHSNGKTVNYCRVDVGPFNDEPGTGKETADVPSRGIICGAHNFQAGDTVVVALPGAVLPGPFPIAARKTYGHVSDGMICSERELGLGDNHDGIIVLNQRFPGGELPEPGADAIGILGLGEDVLEVNVTPDRGYGFSVRGLAREYSHATGAAFEDPGLESNLSAPMPPVGPDSFEVRVDDESACDRFVTQVVRGLDPAAVTPSWMVERLKQAGMRPISLPVDVTNFVMLDLGQPLHAYALDGVSAPFVVRRAESGESLQTLDGTVRDLDPEDIVIADSPGGLSGSRLVGLAGVMGGLDSEVEGATSAVVLEAAHFDAVSVARTSRRHRLSSESSKRFERGTDPQLPPVAVQRAADLLVRYGGGQLDPQRADVNTVPPAEPIALPVGESQRLTGVDYSAERVVEALRTIGADVVVDGETLQVTPPSWRPDLSGPAHLVEEVARIDGYDKIPERVPVGPGAQRLTPLQWARRRVSDTLAQAGAVEVLSYPFIGDSHDRQGIPATDDRRKRLVIRNPLAEDAPALRTSLMDTLLDVAERNASRGNRSLAVFELGLVVLPEGTVPAPILGVQDRPTGEQLAALQAGVPRQPSHVAAILGGPQGPSEVLTPARQWDWADSVALAQEAAASLGVNLQAVRAWVPELGPRVPGPPTPAPTTDPAEVAPWHPGRAARLFARKGKELVVVGIAGELHPRVCAEYGLPARSAAFELDLEALVALMPEDPLKAKRVSVYPLARIDLALVVGPNVTASDVERVIRSSAGQLLESVQLFDIYTGSQIDEGTRSLAFSLTLRAPDRTLDSDEVAALRGRVIADLEKRLGATLRS